MFEYVYMYIVQQYAPVKECIVKHWFQCLWILQMSVLFNVRGLCLWIRASQFDLVIHVNLETTARLMF